MDEGRRKARVAGARRAKTKAATARPVRADSWTAEQKAAFLAHLAQSLNVSASARAVEKSDQSVYRLRNRSNEFRAAWREAIRQAYQTLELAMLERALKGTPKDATDGAGIVFNDRIAMFLLNAHRQTALAEEAASGERPRKIDAAAVRRRLERKLAEMHERLKADAANDLTGGDA